MTATARTRSGCEPFRKQYDKAAAAYGFDVSATWEGLDAQRDQAWDNLINYVEDLLNVAVAQGYEAGYEAGVEDGKADASLAHVAPAVLRSLGDIENG